MEPLTLVLFDVDGTLVDSQAHIVASMDMAFADEGLTPPAREDTLSIVGLSLPQAFGRLAAGQTDAVQARLVERYKQAFQMLRSSQAPSPLYPGALACLGVLGSVDTYLLGIATGKSRRGLDHVISSAGLEGVFLTQQVADNHPSKPHPAMAIQAMADVGADRGVMIGDTTFDMEMGRAAGLKTVAVTWGYHDAKALSPHADRVIDAFGDLPAVLKTLW